MYIADLHIHGRFSRGTSKDLTIKNLEKYARLKGTDLLGTGDFTHPEWIEEIKADLTEQGNGILETKTGYPFLLTSEIALVYTDEGKGRRVHNIILAPDLGTVEQITEWLKSKGRIDYDGRPIFKIPCEEFVEKLTEINPKVEVIPAHIWTPWFSMFGSKSGFDTVKECFKDQTHKIHAIETGLSSDPQMNWRLSQLDKYTKVSFSDLHSFWPWRMGREATLFNGEKSYDSILTQLKENSIQGTIEVEPAYGKYHYDGHRNCNVVMSPKESQNAGGLCPKCGKQLTIGVEYRVEELADREEGYVPKDAPEVFKLIPLSELISAVYKKGVATKTVWEVYNSFVKDKTEFEILLNEPFEELAKIDAKLAKAIIMNREGKIRVKPGYDGVYGEPLFNGEKIKLTKAQEKQEKLNC
ncbi:DNA helicase UvrD [Candidatus Woesearchaeota archaeon]|jgi:uncharacterized protein (TIGR00375 family)|nr:DNA helicase UvrD [Candidatus Woesearchaeota archaeon]MBT4368417.1 DNA helicase UvrD [Candidatus Woesearchaeota archaeon]MBT4712906.1 DNA helicase UvrD [Candidatus Woesearchaeota archaeon]MBT6639818.1 DNA helicase UvrD [Candidatus Woesearchaeota archaeon]MBT7133990.1 DNA helicase UvrD [Candidatus Woesearchaeota archaeon]